MSLLTKGEEWLMNPNVIRPYPYDVSLTFRLTGTKLRTPFC